MASHPAPRPSATNSATGPVSPCAGQEDSQWKVLRPPPAPHPPVTRPDTARVLLLLAGRGLGGRTVPVLSVEPWSANGTVSRPGLTAQASRSRSRSLAFAPALAIALDLPLALALALALDLPLALALALAPAAASSRTFDLARQLDCALALDRSVSPLDCARSPPDTAITPSITLAIPS